ncbi:PIN domain-containing protein [Neisseria canis]|uniref:PIN-like domain-containing protein n=1 Tax=Neisseria canis TaxID=493 RepID=A0A1X3CXY6_9NEIS|nr:PIN domain-containing protein [Neisseria canis]OSI12362.1 hypothetical protein BWD07_05905 [Neisseria canis]VEF01537.1 Uncharacterised protein [Neisseria canis]
MKHVLIDFENVQPEPGQLYSLENENCHIWLFLGKLQQKTLSVELCEALCRFGKNVHFVKVAKTGKNALDFYLAYYLGKITETDKNAVICILSRDGGFDVLVEHLKDNQLCSGIVRLENLDEVNKVNHSLSAQLLSATIPIESLPTQCAPESIPNKYEDTQFINTCSRKVAQALMENDRFQLKGRNNLISIIHKLVLKDELEEFDIEIRKNIAESIVNKLSTKGMLKADPLNGLLSYHFISSEELLEILITQVKSSKAKTLTGLENVIRSKAAACYHDLGDNDISQLVCYLKKQNILKQTDQKIEYAPFPASTAMPKPKQLAQPIIINAEEDVSIMQKVNQFFTKCTKNKPASKKALGNSFKSTLKLKDAQIEKLIQVLISQNKFNITETGKIVYLKN